MILFHKESGFFQGTYFASEISEFNLSFKSIDSIIFFEKNWIVAELSSPTNPLSIEITR